MLAYTQDYLFLQGLLMKSETMLLSWVFINILYHKQISLTWIDVIEMALIEKCGRNLDLWSSHSTIGNLQTSCLFSKLLIILWLVGRSSIASLAVDPCQLYWQDKTVSPLNFKFMYLSRLLSIHIHSQALSLKVLSLWQLLSKLA